MGNSEWEREQSIVQKKYSNIGRIINDARINFAYSGDISNYIKKCIEGGFTPEPEIVGENYEFFNYSDFERGSKLNKFCHEISKYNSIERRQFLDNICSIIDESSIKESFFKKSVTRRTPSIKKILEENDFKY